MRVLLTIVAVVLASPASAATYSEVLAVDVVKAMSRSAENIPDDVEDAYWRCWVASFVTSQVPATERQELDRLADLGRSDAPLAVKWRDTVDTLLLHPDDPRNAQVQEEAARSCPETVNKLLSY